MIYTSFDTLYYIFRGTGITSESQLPYRISSELLLPNIEAEGYRGAPPTKADVCFLAEKASGIKLQHAYSRYNPVDCDILVQVPYKFPLVDIAKIAQTSMTKPPMVAIPANADFWGREPPMREMSSGLLHRKLCEEHLLPRRSDYTKISNVINGEDIRNLYRDFSDMRRFIVDLDGQGISGYRDYWRKRDIYPEKIMLGPYSKESKFTTHIVDSTGDSTTQSEYPPFYFETEWRAGKVSSREYVAAPDDVYITINHTSDDTVPRFDGGILSRMLNQSVSPTLGCDFSCFGAGTKDGKSYRTPTLRGIYGWTTSMVYWALGFKVDNLNLENFYSVILRLFEKRFPEWVSNRTDFVLTIDAWFFDTGVFNATFELPDGW